jgi:hypothetical protein
MSRPLKVDRTISRVYGHVRKEYEAILFNYLENTNKVINYSMMDDDDELQLTIDGRNAEEIKIIFATIDGITSALRHIKYSLTDGEKIKILRYLM